MKVIFNGKPVAMPLPQSINVAHKEVSNVPASSYAARMDICRACEFRKDFAAGALQCTQCGCFMNLKAHFSGQKCPVNKW